MAVLLAARGVAKERLTPLAVLALPVVLLTSACDSAGGVIAPVVLLKSALTPWRCCRRPWCC